MALNHSKANLLCRATPANRLRASSQHNEQGTNQGNDSAQVRRDGLPNHTKGQSRTAARCEKDVCVFDRVEHPDFSGTHLLLAHVDPHLTGWSEICPTLANAYPAAVLDSDGMDDISGAHSAFSQAPTVLDHAKTVTYVSSDKLGCLTRQSGDTHELQPDLLREVSARAGFKDDSSEPESTHTLPLVHLQSMDGFLPGKDPRRLFHLGRERCMHK